MTRHVWILNHYAQTPDGPGGTRHFSLAQRLPQFGWRASIIAASIEHGTGRDRLADGSRQRIDVVQGTPFLWLRTPAYTGNGIGRIRNMLAYTKKALERSATRSLAPPDAIIGSSVHPLAAWAGARLAHRFRVPFLFEVRDLWPQTLIDMGRLKATAPAARALRTLETRLYREASRIVVLLPGAADYVQARGIDLEKVVWIPNGIELQGFPPNPARPEPTDAFTLMYFGAHGQANALDTVIEAMRLVEAAGSPIPIRLRLIGDGPEKAALIGRVEALGLRSVVFEPPVPKSGIAALSAEADAFVLSVRDLPGLYRYGISMNKLFDYMAAGRPVLLAAAASNNPVADAVAGLTVPPEQPQRLAEEILALARLSHAERVRMGEAGRAYVAQHHNYETLAGRLAAALDHAVKGRP